MNLPRTALGLESVRFLAVSMFLDGDPPCEVADSLGVSERSVWRWVAAWQAEGNAGLASKPGRGRPPKLSDAQQRQILSWFGRSPGEFGFPTERWTAPRVSTLIARFFGVQMNHRYVNHWLGRRGITPQIPQRRPRERDEELIRRWIAHQWPLIKRKARDRGAALVFTDESGFLLAPLVRPTLALRGQTPVLRHRAKQRDKVSVAAALSLSPDQGHVGLHYQTYPNQYVNGSVYADFVRHLLWQIRLPLVLVHDRGTMHKGDTMRALCADFPRLDANHLPPYAPELNPVESLWNFSKDKQLSNFVATDVAQIDSTVGSCLEHVKHDQHRLRSFFAATHLPWRGLTVFF